MHEDWYLSEHNTGYIFMGPPWGSNGTLRVERDREVKKKNKKKSTSLRVREEDRERGSEREGHEGVRVEKKKNRDLV